MTKVCGRMCFFRLCLLSFVRFRCTETIFRFGKYVRWDEHRLIRRIDVLISLFALSRPSQLSHRKRLIIIIIVFIYIAHEHEHDISFVSVCVCLCSCGFFPIRVLSRVWLFVKTIMRKYF